VRDRIDALREMQETTYTWIDRQGGVARIPVARAMDILAARGLPHRPAPEPQP
jgi:type III secretory pathway lipoprotein EscJ